MINSYLSQIKTRAEEHNLTLKEVSEECGMARPQLWQYTHRNKSMGLDCANRLDQAIDRLIDQKKAV